MQRLALEQDVVDTFWWRFADPLVASVEGIHPLDRWRTMRLVHRDLNDIAWMLMAKVAVTLLPKTVYRVVNGNIGPLVNDLKRGRDRFMATMKELMIHSFVATVAPVGSGRVVAGSFAQHVNQKLHSDYDHKDWAPGDIDLFCLVDANDERRRKDIKKHMTVVHKWTHTIGHARIQEPLRKLSEPDKKTDSHEERMGGPNTYIGSRFDPFHEFHRRVLRRVLELRVEEERDNECDFFTEEMMPLILYTLTKYALTKEDHAKWVELWERTAVGGHFRMPEPGIHVAPDSTIEALDLLYAALDGEDPSACQRFWVATELFTRCWSTLDSKLRSELRNHSIVRSEATRDEVLFKRNRGFELNVIQQICDGGCAHAEMEQVVNGFDFAAACVYVRATANGYTTGGIGAGTNDLGTMRMNPLYRPTALRWNEPSTGPHLFEVSPLRRYEDVHSFESDHRVDACARDQLNTLSTACRRLLDRAKKYHSRGVRFCNKSLYGCPEITSCQESASFEFVANRRMFPSAPYPEGDFETETDEDE